MALLFMDSFDHYITADLLEKWGTTGTSGTASVSINATGGRRSSGAFRYFSSSASGHDGFVRKTFATGSAGGVCGFAYKAGVGFAFAPGEQIAAFQDGTATQVGLRVNPTGTLSVFRGPQVSGVVLGTTAAVVIPLGNYVYVEFKVLIANSGGTAEVRVNGASVLALTGLDTQDGATATWNSFVLGQSNGASSNYANRTVDFDDLYVLDGSGAAPWTDFLGDCRVDARYPTAAGATTGWTPSAGANWQCVDETAPNDDTDYTSAPAAGLTDTFVVQDAPVAGAQLFGVQHVISAKKTDAGAATIAPVIRHSGVDYPGAGINPGTGYGYVLQISAANPGTGVPWTEAGFNAAEFGYTRTV